MTAAGDAETVATATPFSGRRMILIAGLGVFLAGPAQTYGITAFVDPILDDLRWSRSIISSAYAFGTLVGAGGVVGQAGYSIALATDASWRPRGSASASRS